MYPSPEQHDQDFIGPKPGNQKYNVMHDPLELIERRNDWLVLGVERTQRDIMSLLILASPELQSLRTSREFFLNAEFEDPYSFSRMR